MKKQTFSAIILICLASFAMRVIGITVPNLWEDEIAALFRGRLIAGDIDFFFVQPRHWVHGVMVSGSVRLLPAELAVRWWSVCAGTLSTAVVFRLGKHIGTAATGLMAAILFTVHPVMLFYSQDGKQYGLIILGTLIVIWLWFRSIEHIRYGEFSVMALIGALVTGLQGVSLIFVGMLAAGYAAAALLKGDRHYIPLSGFLIAPSAAVGGYIYQLEAAAPFLTWIDTPNTTDFNLLLDQFTGISAELGPPNTPALMVRVLLVTVALLISAKAIQLIITGSRRLWMYIWLLTLSFAPILMLIVLSFVWRPIWQLRYVLPSIACYLVILAYIITHGLHRHYLVRVGLFSIMFAGLIAYPLLGDIRYLADERGYHYPTYSEETAFLADRIQPEDVIIYRQRFNLAYALGDAYWSRSVWTGINAQAFDWDNPLWVVWPKNVDLPAEAQDKLTLEHQTPHHRIYRYVPTAQQAAPPSP